MFCLCLKVPKVARLSIMLWNVLWSTWPPTFGQYFFILFCPNIIFWPKFVLFNFMYHLTYCVGDGNFYFIFITIFTEKNNSLEAIILQLNSKRMKMKCKKGAIFWNGHFQANIPTLSFVGWFSHSTKSGVDYMIILSLHFSERPFSNFVFFVHLTWLHNHLITKHSIHPCKNRHSWYRCHVMCQNHFFVLSCIIKWHRLCNLNFIGKVEKSDWLIKWLYKNSRIVSLQKYEQKYCWILIV